MNRDQGKRRSKRLCYICAWCVLLYLMRVPMTISCRGAEKPSADDEFSLDTGAEFGCSRSLGILRPSLFRVSRLVNSTAAM